MSRCFSKTNTLLHWWAVIGILLILCFGLTGCRLASDWLSQLESKTKWGGVYGETVDAFFAALDEGNIQAMKSLFSVNVQNEDIDLERQLTAWTEFYSGPTDVNLRSDTGGEESTHYSYGMCRSEVSDSFLVGSNGTYFWCSLKMVDEDGWDENEIGIVKATLYSACDFVKYHEGDWPDSGEMGAFLYADSSDEFPVRPIDGSMCRYDDSTPPLREEDVRKQLEESDNWSTFQQRFGQPNAFFVFWYYELQRGDGTTTYLRLSVDKWDDEIFSADVVGEFEWLYDL